MRYSYSPSKSGAEIASSCSSSWVIERPRRSTSRPGASGRVVALVGEVGLVHDLRDLPQHRIVELVAAQERLEAAVAAVVRELDAAHVERRRVRRHLVGVVDEHELGLRDR